MEEVLAGRQKNMVQLQATVDGHGIRMGQVEEEVRGIRTQVDNVQKVAEASGVSAAEVLSKMAVQGEAMESLETELETAKDRLRKNVESVEGINKSIAIFESRHIETVERMKEV